MPLSNPGKLHFKCKVMGPTDPQYLRFEDFGDLPEHAEDIHLR